MSESNDVILQNDAAEYTRLSDALADLNEKSKKTRKALKEVLSDRLKNNMRFII